MQQSRIQREKERESEETKVPLTGEQLNVSKNTKESQAAITKEPETETKTIQVPITHEDLTFETIPPGD